MALIKMRVVKRGNLMSLSKIRRSLKQRKRELMVK